MISNLVCEGQPGPTLPNVYDGIAYSVVFMSFSRQFYERFKYFIDAWKTIVTWRIVPSIYVRLLSSKAEKLVDIV